MIITEKYSETLVRTYSDSGLKIIQDSTGILYDEAIDPVSMNRTYTESDVPIDEEPATAEELLSIVLGGAE